MPTVKVKLLEAGAGAISNMTVRVWQFDPTVGAMPLLSGVTDSTGQLSINVLLFALQDPLKQMELRAENSVGREVWRSARATLSTRHRRGSCSNEFSVNGTPSEFSFSEAALGEMPVPCAQYPSVRGDLGRDHAV
jgi:hypothetical protein